MNFVRKRGKGDRGERKNKDKQDRDAEAYTAQMALKPS